MTDHALGALPSPPELLAQAWPIGLALAAAPIPAPAIFHSPMCRDVTLNQNPYGACVTFSGAYIQAGQELADEGRQLLPNVLDPLATYAAIKGLPYPFTPSQDTNPGLNPIELWKYTKANGWLTKDGSPRRLDASYFMIGKPSSSAAFLDAYQQTLLQLGPCQFSSTWPNNWWNTDASGFMPAPIGNAGGHAFEACGWVVYPDGTWYSIHHQSWGPWGHDSLPNHFRVHSTYWDSLGWEAWKVADLVTPPEVSMEPFALTGLGGGTGLLNLPDPAIRLIRLADSKLLIPAAKSYALGSAGTLSKTTSGPAHLALEANGASFDAVAILDRNMVVTPPTHSVVVSVDGVPKSTLTV
jgi:hypothetical protein